jgi:DNA polymerase III epsilon subunit-like protein
LSNSVISPENTTISGVSTEIEKTSKPKLRSFLHKPFTNCHWWLVGCHLTYPHILTNSAAKPLKWLCTLVDFTFPQQTRQGENLVHLALNHGIAVSSAHRALTDCQLIAALFDRMDDLEGMINKADRPKALYKAQVPFEKKYLAKAAGFKWNADKKSGLAAWLIPWICHF